MGLKHHTIILVPHERARFRKWRVSNAQLYLAFGLAALLLTVSVFTTWFFLSTTVDRREVERMRLENERLQEVNRGFEASMEEIRAQLAAYEERTRRLAIVAGLDSLAGPAETGVGGADLELGAAAGLAPLAARSGDITERLDDVESALEERRERIAATPSIAPVRGILTSYFGVRRDPITFGPGNHKAIDISATPGKAVFATADGIVTQAGPVPSGLGTAVYLSHGFGFVTRYGHLQRVNVTPGQKVRRGDIVGFVGNTGRSTGYHLHYEVMVDGQQVDPLAFILDDPRDAS